MGSPNHTVNWLVDCWKKQAHQQGYSYSYVCTGKLQPTYLAYTRKLNDDYHHSIDSRLPAKYQSATPEMRDWYDALRKPNRATNDNSWKEKHERKFIAHKRMAGINIYKQAVSR